MQAASKHCFEERFNDPRRHSKKKSIWECMKTVGIQRKLLEFNKNRRIQVHRTSYDIWRPRTIFRLSRMTRSDRISCYGSCYTIRYFMGPPPKQLIGPDTLVRLSLIADRGLYRQMRGTAPRKSYYDVLRAVQGLIYTIGHTVQTND